MRTRVYNKASINQVSHLWSLFEILLILRKLFREFLRTIREFSIKFIAAMNKPLANQMFVQNIGKIFVVAHTNLISFKLSN